VNTKDSAKSIEDRIYQSLSWYSPLIQEDLSTIIKKSEDNRERNQNEETTISK
jgi:hypothetical protein